LDYKYVCSKAINNSSYELAFTQMVFLEAMLLIVQSVIYNKMVMNIKDFKTLDEIQVNEIG